MKKLIFDLDGTLTHECNGDYQNAKPRLEVINQIRRYKEKGFEIVISTARNMRTYDGNIGKINKNTLPVIIEWLERNQVMYDGKTMVWS